MKEPLENTHTHTPTSHSLGLLCLARLDPSDSCWLTCSHKSRCLRFLHAGVREFAGMGEEAGKRKAKCPRTARGSEKTSPSSLLPVFQLEVQEVKR